jgi:flavin-dependent dehydrogenase
MTKTEQTEILIIGAGPAGAVAAALLRRQGHQVVVVEREQFPRFSIGESLLPQSMEYLQQAGMLQAVVEHGFQFKNGASFVHRERQTAFDFRDKYSPGWGTTYQVQRADFDHLLATQAERQGADVRYRHTVTAVDLDGTEPRTHVRDADGNDYVLVSKFILDASGFGRVLPRLLDLERPSGFPVRAACFTHIADGIRDPAFDRNKIRITIHPEHHDVWYWLIPFAHGRCSIGVVAESAFLAAIPGDDTSRLRTLALQDPALCQLLQHAQWDTPARSISGYAANVTTLWGKGYALLGNAGEFLDPIFSSGVTIALKSASLAAAVLQRQLAGESVDWEQDYAVPLKQGVDTFRVFVESWYAGGFQKVIFHAQKDPAVRRMISSILAGYAWDRSNPFVAENKRRLSALEQLCT